MQTRKIGCRVFVLLGFCVALCSAADERRPVFYFGGNRLFVGMPKSETVAALSTCCELSPPAASEVEKQLAPVGTLVGHMILTKEESPKNILGAIYFSGGKVLRLTRPLAEEVGLRLRRNHMEGGLESSSEQGLHEHTERNHPLVGSAALAL
jgi:hypothetical protein